MAIRNFVYMGNEGYMRICTNEDIIDTVKFALEEMQKTDPKKVEEFFSLINPPERKIEA